MLCIRISIFANGFCMRKTTTLAMDNQVNKIIDKFTDMRSKL